MKFEDIYKKIRQLRIEKGISQKALGEKCGLTQQAINRIEQGQRNIDIDLLLKITNALDVKIFEILDMNEYIDKKRLEKEDSLLQYLYKLGIKIDSIDGYSFIVRYQNKKYIITDDDYNKLMHSIGTFTKFTFADLVSGKEVFDPPQD
ncbi:helix-turn-helix domain-containing protein [Sporofaciens musculi]|uniref:helix-turn-helix domain-containing protein n=1 Tax=Sporofaciens musculi TaxID=2681861 RepID=UPI0025710ED9|nr:helix-turn-helix transcriptional regulator [Sporofaciens musculi]